MDLRWPSSSRRTTVVRPCSPGSSSCHQVSPSIASGKQTSRCCWATSDAVIGEGQVPHGSGGAVVLSVMPISSITPGPGHGRFRTCGPESVPSDVDMNAARTYQIRTFGCQMNFHDSERLAGLLEESGYQHAEGDQVPDVVVFNTCAVRENADNRLYGNLGQLLPV